MTNQKDTIYLLDAYGMIYRSYFAFVNHPLTNTKGENISAVYGFFRSLYTILTTYQPRCFVAAFDSLTPTFRHEMYEEYKATREKTPEDLHAQIPWIEEILATLGISTVRSDGFEADDIIATLARQAEKQGQSCVIISNDKDLMQLVSDTTTMLRPDKAGGWCLCRQEGVREQWGVFPEKMLDLLSLVGDVSDNVPGVKGIGPKTAVKLLDEYGTLEALYEHADRIKGATQKKLVAGKDSAFFSKKLIRLAESVPIDSNTDLYCCPELNYTGAAAVFKEYGLTQLAKLYGQYNNTGDNLADQATVEMPFSKNTMDTQTEKNNEEEPVVLPVRKKNSGNYCTVNDPAELNRLIDAAVKQGFVAFDCETTGLNPFNDALVGFSLSLKGGSGIYVPLKCPAPELGDPLLALMPLAEAKKALIRLWDEPSLTLILHNGKFDLQVMRTAGICSKPRCRLFDTMIAAWLLEPDRQVFSLEKLGENVLGLEGLTYKSVVPKGCTFADVPVSIATNYAAEDTDFTLQLYHRFEPLLEGGLKALFENLEMPLVPLLAEMEETGLFIDEKELADFSAELAQLLDTEEKSIFELAGHPFNIASPKQLQQVLFEEKKLPTGKKTKTGYSTDISVLEELALIDELPQKILDYRVFAKLKSTYADALPLLADSCGRIHTSFIQTGTATGRLSSRDPNLQNIPVRGEEGRKIRNAFHAKKGCKLISADYAQIELVILAHLSLDKNLVHAFQNGIDVHAATAALIFNVPIEMVQSDMRRIAKTINFGIMYGMSAFRLANQLKIPRTDASEFIKRYFATYSGVSTFIESLKESARENGFVETIMGRRRMIFGIDSSNKIQRASAERIAVNTPIQGSAADIVKTAMLRVDAELKKHYLETSLLLQVHDELILEAPESEVETVIALVKKEMESVLELAVPLRVSIETGKSWGSFH